MLLPLLVSQVNTVRAVERLSKIVCRLWLCWWFTANCLYLGWATWFYLHNPEPSCLASQSLSGRGNGYVEPVSDRSELVSKACVVGKLPELVLCCKVFEWWVFITYYLYALYIIHLLLCLLLNFSRYLNEGRFLFSVLVWRDNYQKAGTHAYEDTWSHLSFDFIFVCYMDGFTLWKLASAIRWVRSPAHLKTTETNGMKFVFPTNAHLAVFCLQVE